MRRLILFVEGEGDADAVPALVRSLITAQGEWYDVLLDDRPFRVGSVDKLVKNDFRDWKRFLGAALKRSDVGGVLLILDGDTEKIGGNHFCAAAMAKDLAGAAKVVGAGQRFSVAVVFAIKEYETWLIAGVASLTGRRLPDGRLIKSNAKAPEGNLEAGPRDAKGWLNDIVVGGYKPSRDQAALTRLVDLDVIRAGSFGRFDEWNPPYRACLRRSDVTSPSPRRPDSPRVHRTAVVRFHFGHAACRSRASRTGKRGLAMPRETSPSFQEAPGVPSASHGIEKRIPGTVTPPRWPGTTEPYRSANTGGSGRAPSGANQRRSK